MQIHLDTRRTTGAALGLIATTGLLFGLVTTASAYPGGTPDFQTDVAPYCAACHASTAEGDLSGLGDRAMSELAPNKHYAALWNSVSRCWRRSPSWC